MAKEFLETAKMRAGKIQLVQCGAVTQTFATEAVKIAQSPDMAGAIFEAPDMAGQICTPIFSLNNLI